MVLRKLLLRMVLENPPSPRGNDPLCSPKRLVFNFLRAVLVPSGNFLKLLGGECAGEDLPLATSYKNMTTCYMWDTVAPFHFELKNFIAKNMSCTHCRSGWYFFVSFHVELKIKNRKTCHAHTAGPSGISLLLSILN